MDDSIPMNKTLLNLCIYLQDTKRQAISEGILIGNDNTDWYNAAKKAYFGLDKRIFGEAGIKQNLMNLEVLLYYKLPEKIRSTEYDQLHKFSFDTGDFGNCYQSVSIEKPKESTPFIGRYKHEDTPYIMYRINDRYYEDRNGKPESEMHVPDYWLSVPKLILPKYVEPSKSKTENS